MPERIKTIAAIVSAVFMILAMGITLLNYMIGYSIIQDKKKGINKPVSFIPMLSIIFSFFAYKVGRSIFGYWTLLPAILDPSSWCIISLPWYLLTRHKNGR